MTTALVLGGGGVTGIAWELGVLLGLRDEGVDLLDVDLTIGTSAGAAVGAEIHSGTDLEELYRRQLDPEHQEIPAELDLERMAQIFGELFTPQRPDAAALARVGAHALAAPTVPEATRRAVIEWRLPSHEWPAAALRVTTVDAASGEFRVFDAASGVSLVDAVAASCAVPGIWPPVSIGGSRYVDGGMRSPTNADLAGGHDEVIVLMPLPGMGRAWIQDELTELEQAGAKVTLLEADEEGAAAMGANPLDPGARRPAAEAGRRQARTFAALLR
jgi:NTE family protein